MDIVQEALSGNRLALARLLTQIESDTNEGREALTTLFPHTGRAHLIGVTGAPGTGKSTLVNRLAHYYRHPPKDQSPKRVAIVAVDPSSPFSGGAVLGDRVRMRDLAGDSGVFIRSMASRGSLGGLAHATAGIVQAFDAVGYDVILIETVGAGQAEVDIARLAHTTLVVEAPGFGDDIQAIKAGILEIADILVINKADRPGVEITEKALRGMLYLHKPTASELHHHGGMNAMPANGMPDDEPVEGWQPVIQRTIATEGEGVSELVEHIAKHRTYLQESGVIKYKDRVRLKTDLDVLLREMLVARWRNDSNEQKYQQVLKRLVERKISPWLAAQELLSKGDEL
ncbi:MAG TPA: methylmalonyl Co-A mutase-associated GTPase MeaB [Anaerolineae bacterium]|nr:methylmalonyl Co-A mutase-associated GTPase MeaB [Anaerolineae bacterium]